MKTEIAYLGQPELEFEYIVDEHMGDSIKQDGLWEPYTTLIMIHEMGEIMKKPSFQEKPIGFLDIGAHCGYFSVIASHLPNVLSYAFEPDKKAFEVLERNVNRHQRIFPFNYAIGLKSEEVKFWVSEKNSGSGSTKEDDAIKYPGEFEETVCQMKRIEEFGIDLKTIGYVKIDTQGTEIELLKDIVPLLEPNTVVLAELAGEKEFLDESCKAAKELNLIPRVYLIDPDDMKYGELRKKLLDQKAFLTYNNKRYLALWQTGNNITFIKIPKGTEKKYTLSVTLLP